MNLRDLVAERNDRYRRLLSALILNAYDGKTDGDALRAACSRAARDLNTLAISINLLDATG